MRRLADMASSTVFAPILPASNWMPIWAPTRVPTPSARRHPLRARGVTRPARFHDRVARQVARMGGATVTTLEEPDGLVGVAEVEDNDLHHRLTLGISCVSNDSAHANEIISKVVSFVQESRRDVELLDYEIEIISGV